LVRDGSRCPEHAAAKRAASDARRESGSVRYPWRWRKENGIREQILRRDLFCCACSTLERPVPAAEVDHKDGDRTNHDPANLQGLCHRCHSVKTARENGAFGRSR
jgi:5-methylcytosine-specific restriction protein A